MTPLHHATMKAELNIIEMLIEAGSNLDEQDKVGQRSLGQSLPGQMLR